MIQTPPRPIAPAQPASGMRSAPAPGQADAAVDLAVWVLDSLPARWASAPGPREAARLDRAGSLADRALAQFDAGHGLMAIDLANAAADAMA